MWVILLCLILLLEIYLFIRFIFPHSCPADTPRFKIDIHPMPDDTIIQRLREHFQTNGARTHNSNALASKLEYPYIKKHFPELVAWSTSPELIENLSETPLYMAPEDDVNRIFIKSYSNRDDGQTSHYDFNFSSGNRYTLVIVLAMNDANTSYLEVRDCRTEKMERIDLRPGEGYFYDASNIYHRVTPQSMGGERIVLILPLYDTPHRTYMESLGRRIHRGVTSLISV